MTKALLLAATVLAGLPAESAGQAAPPPRADAAGYLGWLSVGTGPRRPYGGDAWHNSWFGGASAGWYWTDHLKTEVDLGAGTKARSYTVGRVLIDGAEAFQATESSFARRTIGVSQQYQYFRNAWFHPHLAAGANLTWERRTERYEPLVVWGPGGRLVRDEYTVGPRTTFTVRPFAAAGFKAYVSRRAFFRSDLRVSFGDGVEGTLLRAGFGVDF
jgi:hypothetical protein